MNRATLLHREPGGPVPLSSFLVIRQGNKAQQKKKDLEQHWGSCSGYAGGEGLTAALPDFMLSWAGQGEVGSDLTAEMRRVWHDWQRL